MGHTVKGRGAASSSALRISFTLLRSVWGPCMKRQLRPSTKSLQPYTDLSLMPCMAGVTGNELSRQLSTCMQFNSCFKTPSIALPFPNSQEMRQ